MLLAFHDRSVFLIKRKMSACRSGRFEEQPLHLDRIQAGSPLLDLTLILLSPNETDTSEKHCPFIAY